MDLIMDEQYRRLHERFVSNHTGSTADEVMFVSTSAPIAILLFSISAIAFGRSSQEKSLCWRILEFFMLTLPVLLVLTVASDRSFYFFMLGSMAAVIVLFIVSLRAKSRTDWKRLMEVMITKPKSHLPFLTNYRFALLLTTAACILGVDFPVFPRKFAKTENFGFGLMDAGVGSFVFAAGLVSQEARKPKGDKVSYWLKSAAESLPMFVLGLLRLLSVKGSGYHEHVSEYGVHWNFFFTLAFTKIFTSLYFTFLPVSLSWPSSLMIGLCHEAALSLGLAEWILENPHNIDDDIISMNKEGIVSIPGYVALYLAAVAWGNHFAKMGDKFGDAVAEVKKLVLWSLLMWASLTYSKAELFLPPSRRLANWNYFNWMLAYNLSLLAMFLICDLVIIYCCQLKQQSSKQSSSQEKNQKSIKSQNNSITQTASRCPSSP